MAVVGSCLNLGDGCGYLDSDLEKLRNDGAQGWFLWEIQVWSCLLNEKLLTDSSFVFSKSDSFPILNMVAFWVQPISSGLPVFAP